MRQKCILFLVLLAVIALTACGVNTEQMESADNLQTEEQISGSENVYSSTQTVEGQVTEELDDIVEDVEDNRMKIQIGEFVFTATLVDNSTTDALKEMLAEGSITINMQDYGSMEKVGSFGTDLPRNDEQVTTEVGDLILYQGNAFVIYYAPNSWNFTRIVKIDDVTQEELKEALGSGDVTVTLSLD
jgi:hypothetical protein